VLPTNWAKIIKGIKATAPGTELGKIATGLGYVDPTYLSAEELGSWRASEPTSMRVGRAIGSTGITEGLGTRQLGAGMEAAGRSIGSGKLLKAGAATRHFGEGFSDIYQNAKEAFAKKLFAPFEMSKRVALWDMVENKGMKPLDADVEIRKYTLDPDAVSERSKLIADTVAPFFRYRIASGQNLVNAIKNKPATAAIDLAGGTGLRIGAGYLAAKAGMSLFGNDASDKEKALLAHEHPGMDPIYRDAEGNWVMLDTKYLDRFGDLEERREKLGTSAWQRIGHRLEETTGLGDQPQYDWAKEFLSGTDRFGRPSKGPVTSWASEMLPSITPGVGYQAQRISDSMRGVKKDKFSDKSDLARTMLSALGGVTFDTMNPSKDNARLGSEMKRVIGQGRSDLAHDRNRGAKPDTEEVKGKIKDARDELDERRGTEKK
jgi:hypothetical protein